MMTTSFWSPDLMFSPQSMVSLLLTCCGLENRRRENSSRSFCAEFGQRPGETSHVERGSPHPKAASKKVNCILKVWDVWVSSKETLDTQKKKKNQVETWKRGDVKIWSSYSCWHEIRFPPHFCEMLSFFSFSFIHVTLTHLILFIYVMSVSKNNWKTLD